MRVHVTVLSAESIDDGTAVPRVHSVTHGALGGDIRNSFPTFVVAYLDRSHYASILTSSEEESEDDGDDDDDDDDGSEDEVCSTSFVMEMSRKTFSDFASLQTFLQTEVRREFLC